MTFNFDLQRFDEDFEQALLEKFRVFRIALNELTDSLFLSSASNRLMTAAEREKLAGIESGAQVNVLEKIQRGGVDLPVVNKTVNLSSQLVLDTVPSTLEGAIWLEVTDGDPQIVLHHAGEDFTVTGGGLSDLYYFTSAGRNLVKNYCRRQPLIWQ